MSCWSPKYENLPRCILICCPFFAGVQPPGSYLVSHYYPGGEEFIVVTSHCHPQGVPLGLDVQPVLVPEGMGCLRRQLRRGGAGAVLQGTTLRHLRQLQSATERRDDRQEHAEGRRSPRLCQGLGVEVLVRPAGPPQFHISSHKGNRKFTH